LNPEESLSEFFDNQMKDPNTAWSVGGFGAIAEFMRDPDEPVTFHRNGTARSAVTARGGVLVNAQIGSRLIASESPTAQAWSRPRSEERRGATIGGSTWNPFRPWVWVVAG